MHALTWPITLFVYFIFARCTTETLGLEDEWAGLPQASFAQYPPALDDTSEAQPLSLLYNMYPSVTSADTVPPKSQELQYNSQDTPKRLYYSQRPGKRSVDLYDDEDPERRMKRQTPQHDNEPTDDNDDSTHRWWWPFVAVRRSLFSPRLGKRGDDITNEELAYDDNLATSEYLRDDNNDYLPEELTEDVTEMSSPEMLSESAAALVGKNSVSFIPRLGKRGDGFAFSPRLGKRGADFAFSPRLGRRSEFVFSSRPGKKSDFAFSPRLGKKADFAFSPRLGKRADFAFSPRLGKKADFAFSPRLGKRADFAFSPRLGKKADFAFSPRLGKRADFAFSPRLGKKADFAFSPRLGKRDSEDSSVESRNTKTQASIPRPGRAYFSPRLG
ncbi:buccalin-like [Homarus americanus]|uniref:buccalin-like n=1 Tax=Homarus americanus TaxID=6706 RepID=UPI001C493A26|nr:buccalin-like [Homarus americanus]